MNRICWLVVWSVSCLVFTGQAAAVDTDAGSPRNLVFILADDLGWSDLACYGSDLHQTPRLDNLAASGVRFTQAYAASPVCSPTRASILTGKHPARLHMTIWREAAAQRGRRPWLEPVTRGNLPLEETTLAELLQQAGYSTVHVGKWHLGTAEYYPQPHGFQRNIGGTLWGAPQTFFYPFRGDQYFADWRYVPDLEPGQEGDYLTDRLTDRALEAIDQLHDRPFYLNLWYHSVHTPVEGKPALVERFRAQAANCLTHKNPHYAAMVASLDENVGRVLEKLEEVGVAERTVVVFFSDNGGFVNPCKLQPGVPVTSNVPLRSGKGSLYEGGIRVPLIMRWPGQGRRGAVCDQSVTSCDLLPTLLSMLQVDIAAPPQLDGIDVSSLVREPEQTLPARPLYFHYPHYYPTTSPVSAVREGAWKLLEYYDGPRVELYNLEDDLGEAKNLADEQPAITQRLRDQLHAWQDSVDAQHPTRRELAGENPAGLAFEAAGNGVYQFQNAVAQGRLGAPDVIFGLFDVQHRALLQPISGRHGVLNIYRVFSDGQRYGKAAWEWPGQAELLSDGSVRIGCAAQPTRPFQLQSSYRWSEPDTLDLEVRVRAEQDLHDFEVFVASYFDPAFQVCRTHAPAAADCDAAGFLEARQSLGHWLMFPRDRDAARLIQDGRWQIPPNPVQWEILPPFGRALVIRQVPDSDLSVLLMARRADCFALAMPYQTENHFSVYASLFGRDLAAGQQVSARVRMQVVRNVDPTEALARYDAFESSWAAD